MLRWEKDLVAELWCSLWQWYGHVIGNLISTLPYKILKNTQIITIYSDYTQNICRKIEITDYRFLPIGKEKKMVMVMGLVITGNR